MSTQNRIGEHFIAATEQAQDTIESHPLAVVAAAFGVGLIVGVVCVTSCQSERAPRSMANRLGHRMMELLSQISPLSSDR
jgi:hypothetical protein